MEFKSARTIEQIVWNLRLADYPRGLDRARIADLANGAPPYPLDEAEQDGIEVNVNDLTLTRLSHDARMQLYQAFNKPGNFFTAKTDAGAASKRAERGVKVTSRINRYLKRSDKYFHCMLSQFGAQVLHGKGPAYWQNADRWCPTPLEIADVLIPSRTLTTFENMPFFAIWRGLTAGELLRLTRDSDRNPGWNMPVVQKALDWADERMTKLYGGTTWAEYWVPEKRSERYKEDVGVYSSDLVPTIECWDFYYLDDAKRHDGWRRRIIFDAEGGQEAWTNPTIGYGKNGRMPDKNLLGDKDQFLYNSGDRVVANKLSEIIHFQLADLSAITPFRYHSVRSLGFMLFAACHLQNRVRCAFAEAVFEQLMNYMRVDSEDEAERALKIELSRRGLIDKTVQFLSPAERFQPNAQLIELGLNEYKQVISDNSASYVSSRNLSQDRVEKTKFQVMAEVNAAQTLVSASLQLAYRYEAPKYREIVRRFFKKGSTDPDVREFRAWCLSNDIPEKYLVPDAWDIEPERIMGSGNKTLEMAIAQQLMEWRAAFSPEAQQIILRKATLAITDDAAETNRLVPPEPSLSLAKHDAMLAYGSLMVGGEVQWNSAHNRIELAQTLLAELAMTIARIKKMGGRAGMEKIVGLDNVLKHVSELLAALAQDPAQKETATRLAQAAGKLANEVKGFKQQLAQAMKKAQQNGADGKAAELQAKIAATMLTAKAKAANTRESHAERTAQRQAQSELDMQQRAAEFQMEARQTQMENAQDLQQQQDEHELAIAAEVLKTEEKRKQAAAKPAPGKGSDS